LCGCGRPSGPAAEQAHDKNKTEQQHKNKQKQPTNTETTQQTQNKTQNTTQTNKYKQIVRHEKSITHKVDFGPPGRRDLGPAAEHA
jgi:hypothetical protein